MKNVLFTLLIPVMALLVTTQSFAVMSIMPDAKVSQEVKALDLEGFQNMSVDDFLNLTPKQIRKQTGEKFGLKKTIALKAAQKKIKKALKKDDASGAKSQLVALILVLFVGYLGIHRFYLGYTTIGILQLLTAGGCGIWALIDLIRIITGDLLPADGSAYDPEL